jgi:hypothetical protein
MFPAWFFQVCCLVLFETLKVEVICSSITFLDFHQTIRRPILGCCYNLIAQWKDIRKQNWVLCSVLIAMTTVKPVEISKGYFERNKCLKIT